MDASTTAVPLPASFGPRSALSRRIVALAVGDSATFPFIERSTVTGTAHYWSRKLGRSYASRRDRKDRTRIRLYRLA